MTEPSGKQKTWSCADSNEPGLLSIEDAEKRILEALTPLHGSEQIDVRSALGRTTAGPIQSTINVPSHTNSAMDGYAISAGDIPGEGNRRLQVIGKALAGKPCALAPDAGQCIRIMTGARMPQGTDTVIMQEQAERDGDSILIDTRHRAGENVRQAGEDLAIGQTAIPAGKRVTPADLGLLASMGLGELRVRRRLRVAFFSTGDELRPVGTPLNDSEIYDSNRYTLYGMLQRQGVDIVDMGVIPDRPDQLKTAFQTAASVADVVISSGGVSVGEADYVKAIIAELGAVDFWKLAIKPGRPLAFGRLGDAAFFGLPGNPVAVMVTFYQLVQPALRYLSGEDATRPPRFRVPCTSHIRKKPGRTEYQRGYLAADKNGDLSVSLTGAQGSGILSSMSTANCLIVLPAGNAGVKPGEQVYVDTFEALV